MILRSIAFAAALACGAALAANDAPFAKVGDVVITQQDYEAAFAQAARSKFYHGKPPEGAVAALQREVAQDLVDAVLLSKEAKKRGIKPDTASVKKTIDAYEARYKDSAQWKQNRARLLPGIQAKLERDSVVEQLTKQVRQVGEPTARQLEQYWETHKDKFTSPEQLHVAMILLKVDPSSPQSKWDAAKSEGAAIHKRLKSGADFAQLAQLHSGDGSSQKGGDLGYVHHGMLPEAAQGVVDKMKPGDLSEPVVLLEGVALFKLQGRKPPQLNPLDSVRQRAQDLWMRERGDEAWNALLAKLRRETPSKIDESKF
ncbi:peptidylprolyl isomerase [Ramlibacter albus]|uniref:peptidylprolyl isomerase n=1 Tax=Ramlibacter albus TaxID=2079448 RepID=A0A923M796_9BURK|nr:peptidylprolyl isomerase [Ramlibacter albus]MBC5764024.1 peptidylprolyl isomerase [Ramlibacter albus]